MARRGRRVAWWSITMLPAVVVIVAAVAGPWLAPHPLEQAVGMPFAPPGAGHWLGTDRLGRDVTSRLLAGGWGLLLLAAVVAVLVTATSAVLGTVAALRPRVGSVIETASDFAILVPVVLGILLVLTAWPGAGVYGLVVVALIFGIPYCARVFAAAATGVAASGYVECARACGEGLPHLVLREVLPNLREIVATQLGLRFVVGIYLAATASFLQLPAGLGAADWAVMVRENSSGILLNSWSVVAPGLAIAIVAVSVNLAATGLGHVRSDGPVEFASEGPVEFAEGAGSPTGASLDGVVSSGFSSNGAPVSKAVARVRVEAVGRGTVAMPADGGPDTGSSRVGAVSALSVRPRDPDSDADVVRPAVAVSGLVIRGSSGQKLVGPIGFELRRGTVTALTGPSGAGKTMLMRALLGHLPAGAVRAEGGVRVAEHDVFDVDAETLREFRRDRIAYVAQDPGSTLNPAMRVRALLTEVSRDASEADVRETLALVGLSADLCGRRTAELSGGQQRRVALARALLRRTDVRVLDEPRAGLHGALRTEIGKLLVDIAASQDIAVLLSGHDTDTIHAIADSVIDLGTVAPEVPAATPITLAATVIREATALRARGIGASVGGRPVLEDVDVTVREGEAVAVVGASGAGKTTLARVVAGLHTEAAGEIEVRGHSVRPGRGRGIQLVTQNPLSALNPRRTVAQTLGRPLRRIGGVARSALPHRVTELLGAVELAPELADRYPHQLSGGQRQRVALARALAAEPAVLVCDEITSALDHSTAASIMELLDRLRAEHATALLVISHDMTVVAGHCARLLVLDQGRVVEAGATAEVLAAPAHPATRDLLG